MTDSSDNPKIECVRHPGQFLICPICEGAKGGKKTAKKYAGKHREWGKMGGRKRKEGK